MKNCYSIEFPFKNFLLGMLWRQKTTSLERKKISDRIPLRLRTCPGKLPYVSRYGCARIAFWLRPYLVFFDGIFSFWGICLDGNGIKIMRTFKEKDKRYQFKIEEKNSGEPYRVFKEQYNELWKTSKRLIY